MTTTITNAINNAFSAFFTAAQNTDLKTNLIIIGLIIMITVVLVLISKSEKQQKAKRAKKQAQLKMLGEAGLLSSADAVPNETVLNSIANALEKGEVCTLISLHQFSSEGLSTHIYTQEIHIPYLWVLLYWGEVATSVEVTGRDLEDINKEKIYTFKIPATQKGQTPALATELDLALAC